MHMKKERIAIVGLGYVGLPLALALAKHFPGTIGFDVNLAKIDELKRGFDRNGETPEADLKASSIHYATDLAELKPCTLFIVAVPTPVDAQKRPDLTPVIRSSESVGMAIQKGAVVVYESTVYPGVTEDICGPILERISGLKRGVDFKLAYSPERINPGDKEHTLERVIKIVSGEDAETLERVAAVYGTVVKAGVHRASSIKVAEAAKVIENTQRDLNIALMNELAMIFDRMNISTKDVLAAAGTKWNFLKFKPGLVGGHCIGVDPYYLTSKAEEMGYHPEVILAGRRINDNMGGFIAQKMIKLMARMATQIKGSRVGVLGLTFKENVSDLRNSRVPDIVNELQDFGVTVRVHDPYGNSAEAQHEYGISLSSLNEFHNLDGLVFAVAHDAYQKIPVKDLCAMLRPGGVLVDVKGMLDPTQIEGEIEYWSL
jgi:UDP-N-acetyl-D-galactosamine dehydrogenase